MSEVQKAETAVVETPNPVSEVPATSGVEPVAVPKVLRKRRSRSKEPMDWVWKAGRKNKTSKEYWKKFADEIMQAAGGGPNEQTVFQKEIAGKFSMLKEYTTIERIEMAIATCEEKLFRKDNPLTEELQIEWMQMYKQVLEMQKDYLKDLRDSAKLADAKTKSEKPKNLPPAFVLQQNFNGDKPASVKIVDEPKAIGDS